MMLTATHTDLRSGLVLTQTASAIGHRSFGLVAPTCHRGSWLEQRGAHMEGTFTLVASGLF
jgi:hypothetical protein